MKWLFCTLKKRLKDRERGKGKETKEKTRKQEKSDNGINERVLQYRNKSAGGKEE